MGYEDNQELDGKAYLLGLVGTLTGRKILLDGERVIVGRDASRCHVVLEQAVVSKQHAMFELDAQGRVTLADLNSKQGTFVNGEPITRQELREGDRVGFGLGGVVAFTYYAAARRTGAGQSNSHHTAVPVALSEQGTGQSALARTVGFGVHLAEPAAPHHATMVLRAANVPALRLGRAPDNDIVLDAPSVSRYHAALTYSDGNAQPILTDLGSTNGTFVNGEPLAEPRQLTPHDLVFLGGFLLHIDGRNIKRHDLSASRITARNITKELSNKTILQDISLAIYPREFVGLMGPSGCGKSTLMDALNGLRPATTGTVYINDLDLYQNFDALRRSIGYVPQRDVLHDALTVERTLYYAAKLRLPEGMRQEDMRRIVDEVIETVGLREQRGTSFRNLSGGQQKRLSLAFELITKPSFIFLDEPTSPLDPETTENMMLLFRRLADEGRIVVMVTHKFEKFTEMHQIALLTRGGRLAFFGPPREALEYFGCQEPGDIYRRIAARDPEELSRAFQASPQHQRYIGSRIAEMQELSRSTGSLQSASAASEQGGPERQLGFKQWLTLTQRYLEVKLKDKRNTLLLLAQAPFVALILAIITGDSLNDSKTIFIAAIISIWFGANNAVREIVSEIPIYVRERLVNLKIPSYVFSKFTVLSAIGLMQCLLFVGILVGFGRFSKGDFLALTLILYLTSLAGVAMGLFFSALVNSTEKAMSILPLILIPQLLLGGFLKPLDDLYVNARTGKPATAAEYQRFEDAKGQKPGPQATRAMPGAQPVMPGALPDPVSKYEGLGPARYASALMAARWSIEALAHEVSLKDETARDQLATRMTVTEHRRALAGDSEEEIAAAYRSRVLLDLLALSTFSAVFLALTMWALKRKDVL
ncbi:MAG TPA: FHA domain-containing protein [Pyrinomonadaceae bacterium]|jgi:ABC-type multidrug transport system ATPase subunit/pSer/pThr/pTyr-binding forkhead associated (FHA) protein